MPFLLNLAWRDLRSSGRSLWVFFACLVLGVTLVSGAAGLYRLVNLSLLNDTRALLGGDVEVEARRALPNEILDWIEANGEVTLVTEVDTMLGTAGGRFLRVELQSMDDNYPLYGDLQLEPARSLADITRFNDGYWGVAIDPVLAERLDVAIGDSVFIGELEAKVRALVLQQPDRRLNANWRGTPVLLSDGALEATRLIQPGSLIDYEYRVKTEASAELWRDRFYEAFPDQTFEVNTFTDRSERIAERLGQIASGLLIIGFSTLFIGGLGVFNSIQAHLQGKLKTIATLRALGLRNRRLAAVYLAQIGMLGGSASGLGALIGTGLALVGGSVVASQVNLSHEPMNLLLPALIAIGFGLLTAYTFALPALGRALATDPATLFRGQQQDHGQVPRSWALATIVGIAAIVLLVIWVLPDTLFGIAFVLVIACLLLLLDLIVRGIRHGARRLDHQPWLQGRFSLKLAIANLHRPGNALRSSLLSLGSALTLLVACTLVVTALLRSVNETIPDEAPGLVLYDVFSDRLEAVTDRLEAMPGTDRVETAPLVHARIAAINGVGLKELAELDVEQQRDSSEDRYKLSYSANNIDGVTVVEGAWWSEPVAGQPKLAMEDREVGKLGLRLGDRVRFAVEGQTLEAEIAAIYSQKGLQTRFWFEGILSAGTLDPFIHRHVGAVYLDDQSALQAQNQIAEIAPGVISVRTAEILAVARELLGKAAIGLAVVALVSLLASLLVLVSVMAAGRSRQVYDATILMSLGVRIAAIRRSLQLEYLLLALIASGFAVTLGAAIALPLLELRLKLPSSDLLWAGILVAVFVSTVALALGAHYLLRRLRLRPATLLRSPS